MAQILTHRVDHLANAAFGALALAIVVATLHLLGIAPAGSPAGGAKTATLPPAVGSLPSKPAPTATPAPLPKDITLREEAPREEAPREEALLQVPAGRLGVSWQVPAVVSRPAPPPARPAAP